MAIARIRAALGPEGTPNFSTLQLSDLAGAIVRADTDGVLQTVTIGTSLSFSAPTLNTIQGIRAADSPTFAGLTLTGLSGVLKATAGVVSGSATLGDLGNLAADKTFNNGDNSISFNFIAPSGAPTYDGAFEIQASGAFVGDLLHVHQHTGNPGATDLCHFEAEDADVLVLHLSHSGGSGKCLSIDAGAGETASVTAAGAAVLSGLTLTGLSGVLKATAGIVSGSATLDDVADGTSYERVAAAELSGGIYKNATTAVKGIASFNAANFTVTDGAVSLTGGGGLAHSGLSGLDYASAGHTGFEPTVTKGNLTAGSTKITVGGTGTGAVIGAGVSVDVSESNLTHNNIGGLQGGVAGQYSHLTDAQVSALHAAVTLGTANGLSLAGQELSLPTTATPQFAGLGIGVDPGTTKLRMVESTANTSPVVIFYNNTASNAGVNLISTDITANARCVYRYSLVRENGTSSAAGGFICGKEELWTDVSATRKSYFAFYTASPAYTEKVRIDSQGNTGFGTTSPQEDVHAADTVRADIAFNLNGTDGVTQATAAGAVCDVTALAGGIATAQTQITYAANGTYNFDATSGNVDSITITNGRITAITTAA